MGLGSVNIKGDCLNVLGSLRICVFKGFDFLRGFVLMVFGFFLVSCF